MCISKSYSTPKPVHPTFCKMNKPMPLLTNSKVASGTDKCMLKKNCYVFMPFNPSKQGSGGTVSGEESPNMGQSTGLGGIPCTIWPPEIFWQHSPYTQQCSNFWFMTIIGCGTPQKCPLPLWEIQICQWKELMQQHTALYASQFKVLCWRLWQDLKTWLFYWTFLKKTVMLLHIRKKLPFQHQYFTEHPLTAHFSDIQTYIITEGLDCP